MSRGEMLRKILHIGMGAGALLLAYMTWWQAALCCAAGYLFNHYALPRLTGGSLVRERSGEGILAYPLALGALCLVFPFRLDVVAVAWGMMAFGDGSASVFGRALGGARLPWNKEKTWSGAAAFVVFGTLGSAVLHSFVAHGAWFPQGLGVWGMLIITALLCAFLESYPSGLDDNVVVPVAAALAFYSLDAAGVPAMASWKFAFLVSEPLAQGGLVTAILATFAYAARLVGPGGFMGGFAVGTLIYATTGWRGFLLLLAFFVLGVAATKFGYAAKAARGIAQESGGRRGAKHAVANGGAAVWLSACAAAAMYSHGENTAWKIAFAAALATALFDTLGTEIGQLYGKTPVLLTTWRRVAPGTEGAVSMEGTLAGAAGALALGTLAWATGFVPAWGIGVVVGAAFAGAVFESWLGAWLPKGRVDNEFMNFTNTVAGAALAYAVSSLFL